MKLKKITIASTLLISSVLVEGTIPTHQMILNFGNAAYADNTGQGASEGPENTLEQCTSSESLLTALSMDRDALERQRLRVNEEIAELELAKERLAIEMASLNELKANVEGILERTAALYTADVTKLVTLYQTMKPQEAANLMNDMDIEVAVMVLATMKENKAAPIIARMNQVRAHAISKIILERSKLPGDQKLNGIRLK